MKKVKTYRKSVGGQVYEKEVPKASFVISDILVLLLKIIALPFKAINSLFANKEK